MSFYPEIFLNEVFATGMLILLGNGVVANVLLAKSKGNALSTGSGWIVIAWGWGMAVYLAVIVGGPLSGAHINPAVTLGLAIEHSLNPSMGIPWGEVPSYFAGELVGAFLGACIVALAYWDHYKATDDQAAKLATFSTIPNIRNYKMNFATEVVATFVLLFVIFAFAEPHSTAPAVLGALPVALVVFSIGLSLGGPTGYAINPTRDLGPRIAHWILPIPGKGTSDWAYAWVPIFGPWVGAAIAAIVYNAAFTNFIVPKIGS